MADKEITSSTTTSTTSEIKTPKITSTVDIDVDKNVNSFDINKITDVIDIEKITADADTYRPVKSKGKIGDGILDRLLETVRLNLDAQRKSGRIRQEEYAQAYVALTQAAIQAAVTLSLQGELAVKESSLKDALLAKEAEQIATYQRQRIAYDEDFLVKASSHLMDSYIAFLTSLPNVETQQYPLMFTGTGGNIDGFNDQNNNSNRLPLMDGVMSRLYKRISSYQKDQFDNPTSE